MKFSGSGRWILGFDSRCSTFEQVAAHIAQLSDGLLTVRDLNEPEVAEWRVQAFGANSLLRPTLFALSESRVKAWTGAALTLQLGRLLGPRKLWQVIGHLGDVVDPPARVSSPGRRAMMQRGVTGAAAAFVLLANDAGQSLLRASAQETPEDISADENDLTGDARRRYTVRKVTGNVVDSMRQRALDNRHFITIHDHFAENADWRYEGHEVARVLDRGKQMWTTYGRIFKRRGDQQWAYAVYFRDPDGREWSRGYIWRGDRITREYQVQNGTLRSDEVSVGPSSQDLECAIDAVLCAGVITGGCAVGGMYIAVTCPITIGLTCGAASALGATCGITGGDAYTGCQQWASDGKCG